MKQYYKILFIASGDPLPAGTVIMTKSGTLIPCTVGVSSPSREYDVSDYCIAASSNPDGIGIGWQLCPLDRAESYTKRHAEFNAWPPWHDIWSDHERDILRSLPKELVRFRCHMRTVETVEKPSGDTSENPKPSTLNLEPGELFSLCDELKHLRVVRESSVRLLQGIADHKVNPAEAAAQWLKTHTEPDKKSQCTVEVDIDFVKGLTELLMVSDPWPLAGHIKEDVYRGINKLARGLGFRDWVDVLHFGEPSAKAGDLNQATPQEITDAARESAGNIMTAFTPEPRLPSRAVSSIVEYMDTPTVLLKSERLDSCHEKRLFAVVPDAEFTLVSRYWVDVVDLNTMDIYDVVEYHSMELALEHFSERFVFRADVSAKLQKPK